MYCKITTTTKTATATRKQGTYILTSIAKASNHWRTKGKIGNKVTIHNVHMKPISAHIYHLLCISCYIRQVAWQERWSNQRLGHVLLIQRLTFLKWNCVCCLSKNPTIFCLVLLLDAPSVDEGWGMRHEWFPFLLVGREDNTLEELFWLQRTRVTTICFWHARPRQSQGLYFFHTFSILFPLWIGPTGTTPRVHLFHTGWMNSNDGFSVTILLS